MTAIQTLFACFFLVRRPFLTKNWILIIYVSKTHHFQRIKNLSKRQKHKKNVFEQKTKRAECACITVI